MASHATPLKKYTVFVSSTYKDLKEERKRVTYEVLRAGHIPCGMEQFPAAHDRGWQTITSTIDICDYYVIIVGWRYGEDAPGESISWTEKELDYATSQGMRVLAFIRGRSSDDGKVDTDNAREAKLDALRKKLRSKHHCIEWNTEVDLHTAVIHALRDQIASDVKNGEERPGWYRGDNLPTTPAEVGSRGPFDPEALRRYLHICNMPKAGPDSDLRARAECAELYAHMYGTRTAAYIASAAFAWFRMSDNHRADVRDPYRAAQQAVETQLRSPQPDWGPPDEDAVTFYAMQVRPGLGNANWLDLTPGRR